MLIAAEKGVGIEELRAEHAKMLEQIAPGSIPSSGAGRELKLPPGTEKRSDVDIGAMIEQFNRASRGEEQAESKRKSGLYAFVSLSVPPPVLRAIAQDVKKAGGTMVLRGFKEGTSMASTVAALQEINQSIGAEWSIDPDLFSSLRIEKVPALAIVMEKPGVSVCDAQGGDRNGCAEAFDAAVTYGDINVPHAMRRIIERSNQPQIQAQAKDVLAKVEAKPQ
jgi:conjugal transfer pilus assembly protein TrbC